MQKAVWSHEHVDGGKSETARHFTLSQALPMDRWPSSCLKVEEGALLLSSGIFQSDKLVSILLLDDDVIHKTVLEALPGARLRALTPCTVRFVVEGTACATNGISSVTARLLQQTFTISQMQADQRLASLLVLIGRRVGQKIANTMRVEFSMSRSEMAAYLALNPETVSRCLTRLKTEGLVATIGRNGFVILDWERLQSRTALPVLSCKLVF